jgi:catechol-2,3-dioxygenase
MKGRVTSDDAKVIQQISFKVPTIDDLRGYKKALEAENIKIERIVSHGNAFGLYFFDPEGNRVEVYYRTGFPVPQPHGDLIDLDRTDEELIGDARELLSTKQRS